MHRRGFFQTLAALFVTAPALPALVKSAAPVFVPAPVVPPELFLVGVSVDELIHSSMRLLGVLAPGEVPSRHEKEAAHFALKTLLKAPAACDHRGVFWLNLRPVELHHLRYELAIELAAEYGIPSRLTPELLNTRNS